MLLTRRGFCAAASALSLAGPAAAAEASPPKGIRPARGRMRMIDVAFRDADGRETGFVELRGKPTVAVFWATWCQICYGEMPKLDQLAADIGDQVNIVALSIDQGGMDKVLRYFERRDLETLKPYHDTDGVIAAMLGVRGVPTALVIDTDGYIVAHGAGRIDWDSRAMRRYLTAIR